MKFLARSLGALALSLAVAAVANADDRRFYAGVAYGQADASLSRDDFSEAQLRADKSSFESRLDTDDSAWGALAGWEIARWLALEAFAGPMGGTTYSYDARRTYPNSAIYSAHWYDVTLETRAFIASAILSLPIGNRFAVGVRGGGAYVDTKSEMYASFNTVGILSKGFGKWSDSSSGTSAVYGVNAQFHATPRLSLRLDWQTVKDVNESGVQTRDDLGFHTISRFDIDVVSLSLIGRF